MEPVENSVKKTERFLARAHYRAMHLSDDTLELLAEKRLDGQALGHAEEHLLICTDCQDRLSTVDEYISTMRAALRRTDPNVILWQLHSTSDGPVEVWVERSGPGKWLSRRVGRNLDGGRETESRAGALLDALQSFGEMFPEHKCSRACMARVVDQPPALKGRWR